MTSPAALHMMRVSASETAQRGAAPLRNATAYEQMLVKLAADCRTLKQIRSNEGKADKKRELLPFYLPWVAGVLANGKGAQDDIVMTVMLWRLDADDIAGALEIARYALTYGLTMPVGGHRRTTPYLLAEEVALSAQRLRDANQSPELALLLDTLALTERADMPDIVRAKLHKITGYLLRDKGELPEALAHLQRAIQLERTIGVKKDIEQLERQLKPKPEPAPKTTKPRTRKPAAKPAARRGRPPKAAKAAG
ncbi:terminase [Lelliottia aquatilis]|uniref:phage terminase small subunit n=1 Tax=Lelliottia aquatilis TaxID=2080838 RepID=UPI0015756D33|nr:terminase endonuclease subunit [Lelliottia aquatilis]NTZ47969.1 terminase [Lelliottia aquatilis]